MPDSICAPPGRGCPMPDSHADEPCPPASLKLPVVTLEPESLAFWASLLAGRGDCLGGGRSPAPGREGQPGRSQRGTPCPYRRPPRLERLEDFTAYRLARGAATGGVVIHRPAHAADHAVGAAGSVAAVAAGSFGGGVPERLARPRRPGTGGNRTGKPIPSRFRSIFSRIWVNCCWAACRFRKWNGRRGGWPSPSSSGSGQAADFLALLADPAVPGRLPLQARSLPFARIRLKVLRRLGGTYSDLAANLAEEIDRFERGVGPGPAEPAQPTEHTEPTPFRDFPRRQSGPEMVWLPGGTFTMGDDKSARITRNPPIRSR